jgi:hypothetical protein
MNFGLVKLLRIYQSAINIILTLLIGWKSKLKRKGWPYLEITNDFDLTSELLHNHLWNMKSKSNTFRVNLFGRFEKTKKLEEILLVFLMYSYSSVFNLNFDATIVSLIFEKSANYLDRTAFLCEFKGVWKDI